MTWALAKELLISALMINGALLIAFAAYGILRLPDVYSRSHAQAKATTLGISCLLLGLWVHLGQGGMPIFFAILAQIFTIPVASHIIGMLAFEKKVARHQRRKVSYHKGYRGPDLER
jgi:multicomponent Na+:H+ antiporter subunit G